MANLAQLSKHTEFLIYISLEFKRVIPTWKDILQDILIGQTFSLPFRRWLMFLKQAAALLIKSVLTSPTTFCGGRITLTKFRPSNAS